MPALQSPEAPDLPAPVRAFSRVVETLILALLWIGLPAAPVVMALIAGRARLLLDYSDSMVRAAEHVGELARYNVISRLIRQHIAARHEAAARIEGSCTHCGRCCINGKCVFVSFDAEGRSNCAIHGRWFFRLLACGRYPINAWDIDTYACPSFRAVPAEGREGRRVIPVRELRD